MAQVPPEPPIDELDFARTAEAVRRRLFDLAPEPVKLGRYAILERIGSGAMGTVYAAYDPELDRKVAVKLIRSENLEGAALEARRKRLLREAKAIAKVSHPNVVTVYDVGTFEDNVFISMEHVAGRDLREWIRDAQPSVDEIIAAFAQAARGLAAAHDAGVVHRDIKPENILVGDDGRVRITDFGLATASSESAPGESLAAQAGLPTTAGHESLTVDGVVVGTPAYMAPEQLDGAEADERTDQFAFCVSLYEALTGQRPFGGETWREAVESIRDGTVEPPANAPAAVRRALVRGLSADRSRRYSGMEALRDELDGGRAAVGRWLLASAIVAGAATVFLVLTGADDRETRCAGARDRLVGVWDTASRARVERGILGSKVPYAAVTWERVSAGLDGYADSWVRMHTASCRATRVTGEQSERLMDLRVACLENLRGELRETAKVLASADPAVMARAVAMVSELGRVDSCADVAALTATVPPPRDPGKRAAVDALRPRLARAEALYRAGKYRDGLAGARALAKEASALGFKPIIAEAYYVLGRYQVALGENKDAERSLVSSVRGAQASGHIEVFARASVALIGLAAELISLERGRLWSGLAESAIERLDNPVQLQAARLAAWSTVLHHHGKIEPATKEQRAAVTLMERAGFTDNPSYAEYLHNLGNILHSGGKHDVARGYMERALALRKKLLGEGHPHVATTLNTLAIVAEDKGDNDTALSLYRQAISVAEAAVGPDHAHVANYLDNVSGILKSLGRFDEALTNRKRAMAIREKVYGADHPNVALSLNNLGALYFDMGRKDDAWKAYQRSLAIRRKHYGGEHPNLLPVLSNIGMVEMDRGKHEEGLAHHFQVAALTDKLLGKTHADHTYYLRVLGEALITAGRPGDAIAHLQRAIRIGEATKTYPGDLDGSRLALARALWKTNNDRPRARRLAERARAGFAERKDAKREANAAAWLKSPR